MSASTNYPTIRPSLLLDFANTEQLDPRITFARSTTATYYDDNTVAKAEENLLTYSQDFDNAAWTKQNVTVTANSIAAPDGTTTADSIIASNAVSTYSGVYRASGLTTGNTSTQSAYVKAGNKTFVYLLNVSGTLGVAWFNLGTGTVGTVQSGMTASITSVGGGWYRISATGNIYNNIGVYASDADNSFICTGDGTTVSIYAWGAQLEQRAAVTAYTATTSAPITNYIPVLLTAAINEARLDHNPTTRESLGLLIEEQRTNLLTYSDDFVTTWTSVGGGSISSNVAISPFGIQNADALVPDSVNGVIVNQAVSTTTTAYTFSVFAKANGVNTITLVSRDNPNANLASFDLSTGVATLISGTSCSMVNCGDGWWRCITTFTPTVAAANRYRISTPAGNGFSSVFIWGAQLEAGSFPTSYIQTVASQVTRSADSASMTGSNFSSWYRADEGTLYGEANESGCAAGANALLFSINDGSYAANSVSIGTYSATTTPTPYGTVRFQNTQPVAIAGAVASYGAALKYSFGYKLNDFAASYQGASVGTDTSGSIPIVTSAAIGNGATGATGQVFNGTIKRLAYYPARLTNAQLQAITS